MEGCYLTADKFSAIPDCREASEHGAPLCISCDQIHRSDKDICAPAWVGTGSKGAFFTADIDVSSYRLYNRPTVSDTNYGKNCFVPPLTLTKRYEGDTGKQTRA